MPHRYTTLLLTMAVSLSGCATIDTYTDAAVKQGKTGILYYPPKPYLLLARTGAKDKPNDVQVVYLPDLSQPRYAVMKGGFGSSKLGLTFSNGVLVSANQESDPKITEAITALAGVPGALATASKTRAEASQIREEAGDLPKAAGIARSVANDLRTIANSAEAPTILNPSQIQAIQRMPQQLDQAAAALEQPGAGDADASAALATLQSVKQALAAIKPAGDVSDASRSFWSRIRTAEASLDQAVAELKPKPVEPPTLSLYEVIMTREGTTLREVPLSTMIQSGAQR